MLRYASYRNGLWILGLVLVLAVSVFAQEAIQKPLTDPELIVPAGTVLPVVLNTYLNTKNTQVGDPFYADTAYPIWIQQRLVIPRGSIVKGVVTEVFTPGKVKGNGKLAIRFETILLPNGVERVLVADFRGIHGPGAEKVDRKTETVEQGSTANAGADLGTVVGTAGQGAIIAGVTNRGGGATEAGIGAAAGAAAGLAIVLLSRERNLVLEPGTQLDLELKQPLRFAYGEVIFSQAEIRPPAPRFQKTGTRKTQGAGSPNSWMRWLRIWR